MKKGDRVKCFGEDNVDLKNHIGFIVSELFCGSVYSEKIWEVDFDKGHWPLLEAAIGVHSCREKDLKVVNPQLTFNFRG